MKVAIYMRVSTDDQTNENQRIRLEEFTNQRGWEIESVYEDQESGGKRKRPGLDKMLSTARSGKIGKVIAVNG
jgi:DNA invertase Pin-like site-specific DNA recombinase